MSCNYFFSDMDQLIYSIPPGVLVLLAIACLSCFLWRRHRRQRSFALSLQEGVMVNNFVSSYTMDNKREKNDEFILNNNIPPDPEFTKQCAPSEIVLNPVILQTSQNSRR